MTKPPRRTFLASLAAAVAAPFAGLTGRARASELEIVLTVWEPWNYPDDRGFCQRSVVTQGDRLLRHSTKWTDPLPPGRYTMTDRGWASGDSRVVIPFDRARRPGEEMIA